MPSRDELSVDGNARRYDLDWLRVIAMLLIFLYHTTRPFDTFENWHVKNNQLTGAFNFMVIGALWLMPLFFYLSGAASFFSLRARTPISFLRARFLRLAVPLITLGWLGLGPIQVYIERVVGTGYNTKPFVGSFIEFLPNYFNGVYGAGGNFALHGVHLWYLYWLFMFSICTLPLFLYLMSESGRRVSGALARMAEAPGAILLFALPLCIVEVLIKLGIGPDNEEGGWYLATYVLLMIYGFLFVADARFDRVIERHRWVALGLVVALVITLLIIGIPGEAAWSGQAGPILDAVALSVGGWLGLVAILGFGRRHLLRPHPGLRYAGEMVLPFYILHQPVIVLIAYLICAWDMNIWLKYLIVSIGSFVTIVLVYEYLVCRINLLRLLFGMTMRHGRPVALRPAAGG